MVGVERAKLAWTVTKLVRQYRTARTLLVLAAAVPCQHVRMAGIFRVSVMVGRVPITPHVAHVFKIMCADGAKRQCLVARDHQKNQCHLLVLPRAG